MYENRILNGKLFLQSSKMRITTTMAAWRRRHRVYMGCGARVSSLSRGRREEEEKKKQLQVFSQMQENVCTYVHTLNSYVTSEQNEYPKSTLTRLKATVNNAQ